MRGRRYRLLAAVTLAVGLSAPAGGADGTARWTGRPLADALQELRGLGLEIVFTSAVVTPEMRVEEEPRATAPRAILDELLAAHALEARPGPGSTLVVVPRSAGVAEAPPSIVGHVLVRGDGSPVAGVEVVAVEHGVATATGAAGGFALPRLPAGAVTIEVRRRGFVVERVETVVVGGRSAELTIELDPVPVLEEELVVVPSRLSMWHQQPAGPLALSREDLAALPHLSADFFRALSLLPGIASNDVTAQFHVRGGRRDETRILLDGQELYGSFHLQDFDSALSVVSSATLDRVDLSTGGFPVEHGDRMGGVLDMTTRTPSGPTGAQVGVSLLNAWVGSHGAFDGARGSWIGQVRRGATDLAGRLIADDRPRYWDAFGKLGYQLDPAHSVRLNLLHADDALEVAEEVDGDFKRIDTDYRNSYLWLTHLGLLTPRLFVETGAAGSRIERGREGLEIEPDVHFEVGDRRRLTVADLRQRWHLRWAGGHDLRTGFELRVFDAAYDYRSERRFETPLAEIRDDPVDTTLFQRTFEEEYASVFAADRVRLGERLTLELGARFDRHTQTDESLVSPRLNLAWTPAQRTVVRVAWGRFTQSQRPYELQVEDGETRFGRVERSEHRIVGLEHLFQGRGPARDLVTRIELYRREVSNPLARYENLYEPINTFPEVEPDRVRVAPDSSVAEGIELLLRGRLGQRTGWWINYALSSTEDVIAGERFPRQFDQTHAVNLDLDLRLSPRWSVNLAWRYHTGWPTTPLTVERRTGDDGSVETVPVLGRRFSDRLPDYHRLDLRASRRWAWRSTRLRLFLDVQNVYDRANLAGFDYEIDDETGTLIDNRESWPGFLPSLGVEIEF